MNYTQTLEALRKKVTTLDISDKVEANISPPRPNGFMPQIARSRTSEAPMPQAEQYQPSVVVDRTYQSLMKARKDFERRMAATAEEVDKQAEQLRPQIRPFNAQAGFMTRPVAREDTVQAAVENQPNSNFDNTNRPRGPVGSGSGGGLLGLIDRTEGGGDYDTLFGYSNRNGPFSDVKVSEMTLEEAINFSSERGAGSYGSWVQQTNPEGVLATPMGRYQIVGSTLRNAVEELGLPLDTKFNAETQDLIASHLARRRLEGATGLPQMRSALRSEWAGFRHVSNEELDRAILDFTGAIT